MIQTEQVGDYFIHQLALTDIPTTLRKCTIQHDPIYEYDLGKTFDRTARFDLRRTKRGKYRFVECSSLLLENPIIKVYDFKKLPPLGSYTAVSYIWDGKKGSDSDTEGTFEVGFDEKVDGQLQFNRSGHPISIQLLQDACRAAHQRDTNLLWLDRLCINRSDKSDNSWQMKEMCKIYKNSKLCIVFPGGLWKSTRLDEETKWIDRGWTLQEAVAPLEVQVMFEWALGDSTAQAHLFLDKSPNPITKITDYCAMAPLSLLLDCTISGKLKLVNNTTCNEGVLRRTQVSSPISDIVERHADSTETETNCFKVSMFGTGPEINLSSDFRRVLPNVATLARILNVPRNHERKTQEYYHALWKSTMMRSTYYPSDMIFSVMGLFDVTLNPNSDRYKDKNDCVKPAIDLAREILRRKGRATWLGTSFFSPPCPHLSTFPSFPKILSVNERAVVAIPEKGYIQASQLMLNEYVVPSQLRSMPIGKMDENGYLTFFAKSVPVVRVPTEQKLATKNNITLPSPDPIYAFPAINGITWCERTSSKDEELDAFAVLLGFFKAYSPFNTDTPETPHYDAANVRGFIVKREKKGGHKFNLESYFMLSSEALPWVKGWRTRKFRVGGRIPIGEIVKYEEELPAIEVPIQEVISDTLAKRDKGSEQAKGTEPEAAPVTESHTFYDMDYTRYKMVGGNLWQSEGRWTREEAAELRKLSQEDD